MKHRIHRPGGEGAQAVAQVGGGGEGLDLEKGTLAVRRRQPGLLTDQQGGVMPAGGQKLRQAGAQPAGGEVGQPPNGIQRFKGRSGGDDALHERRIEEGEEQREVLSCVIGEMAQKPLGKQRRA